MTESHLEPRVARLETGLEQLAKNVSEMAVSIREHALATDTKIDNLVVAVTNAQAPKKTDWSVLLTVGFFILALGGAVFYPLNKSMNDNKADIQSVTQKLEGHQALDSHPVSAVLLKHTSDQINTLDTKLQLEMKLLDDTVNTRLKYLEHITDRQDSVDMLELRAWRNKASGLGISSAISQPVK